MKYIVGLGNPGEEYEKTRHNAGRIVMNLVKDLYEGKEKITWIEPDDYMNNSGKEVKKYVKSKKQAEDLVVMYDDLDLPLGKMKISFNKSSGGHKGLESIINHIKTLEFVRIRIGISGKKKILGEEKVQKHILGKFKDDEMKVLKKLGKIATEAVEVLVKDGWEKSASHYSNTEIK